MAEVDMIIGVLIIFVVFLLFLTIIALLYVSGLFHTIEIGTGKPPIGQVTIAYKFVKGPYKDSGQYFTELSSHLKPEQHCLGIYYDDPKVVPKDQCRYAVGGMIAMNDDTPDEEQKKYLIGEGYKIFKLPTVSYAVKTDFPYISYMSIILAVFRVYPKLSKYVKEKKLCAHPFLEIYEDSKIHFMAPLAKQNEFYVEEAADSTMEDGEDLDESMSADNSSYGGSVSRSEFSVATSYMGSIIEDSDDEDEDLLRLDEVKEEPSDTPIKEIDVNDSAEREVTLDDIQNVVLPELSLPEDITASIASFQDSGFSSEQVISPEMSPMKKEEVTDAKIGDVQNLDAMKKEDSQGSIDGNESSSSFEVIDDKTEL
ncbi:unnamed protein product [Mytilus coruscus]|uniref:Testis-expressed sequence 264 protein n=1 Tax=Mytilus coruscus TaxID=42192 RepID=A0A6J8BCK7_MYTCO|nr:unnamed protein product [Mytilus coruscus]